MAKYTIQRCLFVFQTVVLVATVRAQNHNGRRSNSECTTPGGLHGICTPLPQCEPLWNLKNTQPLSPESTRFLIKSQCGTSTGLDDNKVCCQIVNNDFRNESKAKNAGSSSRNREDINTSLRNNPNLPTECGSDLSQRIVGGEVTDLTEFPWMVLLEYDSPRGKRTSCGGVVVTSRYILTAAHCVSSEGLPKSWSLNSVRLGEYDISTDRDCIPDGVDSEICSDPPVVVAIEEKIVHESYIPNSADRKHDLALLRLAEDVQFTDYVKPICFPSNPDLAQKLWVAGWGKTESNRESNVKLKLAISPADRSACLEKYKQVGIDLLDNQVCVGGESGKDSCRGDSGGPLMSYDKTPDGSRRWTVAGIISFGPEPCGTRHWPAVYVKVVDYVPWILTKIRP